MCEQGRFVDGCVRLTEVVDCRFVGLAPGAAGRLNDSW
jgi:hypothetical protein